MLTPRRHARYRATDTNEAWDTRHYDDDAPEFTESNNTGRTWRRTVITERAYVNAEAARAELDEREAPNA